MIYVTDKPTTDRSNIYVGTIVQHEKTNDVGIVVDKGSLDPNGSNYDRTDVLPVLYLTGLDEGRIIYILREHLWQAPSGRLEF